MPDLITLTDSGFYCAAGDFYIDPWRPVARAVVTHAHGDHLRRGSGAYLVSEEGREVTTVRLYGEGNLQTARYGEAVDMHGVRVSLHPAGHILGSAQVRVEHRGEVWVVSGDYKLQPDATTTPFEPVRCHMFITEATFGLPIYRWNDPAVIFDGINRWWRANREMGRASILYGYALGKAQRLLAGIDASIGPVYTHGAVERLNEAYRASGVALPPTQRVMEAGRAADFKGALIVAPLSARGTTWVRRFGAHSSAFASGWMRIRGARRRKSVDQGFIVSDHVDWPALHEAIRATGAQRIGVTHGYIAVVTRWLREQGYEASGYDTHFEGETEQAEAETTTPDEALMPDEAAPDDGAMPQDQASMPEDGASTLAEEAGQHDQG